MVYIYPFHPLIKMNDIALKGMGHFSLGFILGFVIFLCTKNNKNRIFNIKYLPLIPFITGVIFGLPYYIEKISLICPNRTFFYYCIPHNNEFLIRNYNNFYIQSFPVVIIYIYLIFYYIKLIKKYRQNAK